MARFESAGRICAALYVAVLFWALLRFGAVELASLYLFFLLLAAVTLLTGAVLRGPWTGGWPTAVWAAVGTAILSGVGLQPNLEARGYVFLGIGLMSFSLGAGIGKSGVPGLRVLVGGLVVLGAFEAGYGLLQALGGYGYVESPGEDFGPFATGTFVNRNHFAGFVNLVLPLAVCSLLVRGLGEGAGARGSERTSRMWLGLFGIALVALTVPLSLSRAGTIVLLLVGLYLTVVLALRERRRRGGSLPRTGLWILIALVVGLASAVGLEGLTERFTRLEGEVTRLGVYRDTLGLIADHPWLGIGPGMYRWVFRPYQTVHPEGWYEHAHNDYLESAAEWGVPLAALFWLGLGWLWWRGTRAGERAGDGPRAALLVGISAAMLSVLLHSGVDFVLRTPVNASVVGALAGAGWSLMRPERSSRARAPWLARTLLVALAILLLAACWQAGRGYRAASTIREAGEIEALERVLDWEPDLPEAHFELGLRERDVRGRPAVGRAALERAAELNPHHWAYRLELARTYEVLGENELAEISYRKARDLNPLGGAFHWSLANFLVRQGRLDEAVEAAGRAVDLDRELVEPAYRVLRSAGAEAERIARAWPDALEPRLDLLRLAVADGSASDEWLAREWPRLLARHPPLEVERTGFVFRHWIATGATEAARAAWIDLQRLHGRVDPEFESGSNLVWNGGFEHGIARHPLDWILATSEHFEILPVAREDRSGKALRVEFAGTGNPDFAGVVQRVLLAPGADLELSYTFRAEELTSDEGVFVEIKSAEGTVLLATEAVTGSTGWESATERFRTPKGAPSWSTLALRRRASRKLGGRLAGSFWIDDVAITPAPRPDPTGGVGSPRDGGEPVFSGGMIGLL